jgi:hypothetical protein
LLALREKENLFRILLRKTIPFLVYKDFHWLSKTQNEQRSLQDKEEYSMCANEAQLHKHLLEHLLRALKIAALFRGNDGKITVLNIIAISSTLLVASTHCGETDALIVGALVEDGTNSVANTYKQRNIKIEKLK